MITGLSENEVNELRLEFGLNSLSVKEKISPFSIFFSQFKNPLIYILLAVSLISLFLKEYFDAGLIYAVVLLNVSMSFIQEYNAQKTLTALRRIIKPEILVIRNGSRVKIETKYLVPKDLVVLGSGDRIPADGNLIEGTKLLVSEAILTGEEEAVEKTVNNHDNRLFMGTIVLFGQAIMEVTAIGQKTQIGKIGSSLQEIIEEPTPLQKKLQQFTKTLVKFILIICAGTFFLGLFYGQNIWTMAKMTVILLVAAIPEGLPIAITIILVISMRRILKRNGLVKKLLSVETLGSTSVICTDKTGTLTEGKMRVVEVDFIDETKGLLALFLTNNQRTSIEIAFYDHLSNRRHLLPDKLLSSIIKKYEEPFDSEKKYAINVSQINGLETAFIVGAPEIIISFCKIIPEEKAKILQTIKNWADKGLKVVGIVYKDKNDLKKLDDYQWLGLLGVEDPVRPGVMEAIKIAQQAGIKIKIVTGDFQNTAQRVAAGLGMTILENQIMNGSTLEKISEEELKDKIDNLLLFSRVTPHQKLKIVNALQQKGEVVAMTGDGVNDAPALKKADIGVVVGSGSEVAKEAADLILLDNNFITIVAACEEGRLIFSNIKKVIAYVLSHAFTEIVLIIGALILNLPSPLTVVQILWIHLICDGPPDILLSFEPKENNLMKQSPKDLTRENILSVRVKLIIMTSSFLGGLALLSVFRYFFLSVNDLVLARTLCFTILSSMSLICIYSFKNLNKPILKMENFFENKKLIWGSVFGFFLIAVAIYLPFLNRILGIKPLIFSEWLIVFIVVGGMTLLIETIKVFKFPFRTK